MMKNDSAKPEATQLSSQLKEQLEQLAELHKRNADSMSPEDIDASFSVMGKVGSLIDVIEWLNEPGITPGEEAVLSEAIADGKTIAGHISEYLQEVAA